MMMNNNKILIVFEGFDGAGKTTLMGLLKSHLIELGYSAEYFYSIAPQFSISRNMIKSFNNLELSFWFYTVAGLITINDALNSNFEILLFDRYIYTTIISHSIQGLTVNEDKVLSLFPTPDFTFYIEADRENLKKRVLARMLQEKSDSDDLQFINNKKLLDAANEKYRKYKMIHINNDLSPSNSLAHILNILFLHLDNRKGR
jgi:thymidylate kinase